MCHKSCIDFGRSHIKEKDVKDKSVIEVGAYNANGSLRPVAEAFKPALYVGVDIQPGPGVDEVCAAENLIERFGYNKFDMLICTEILEHVRNWEEIIHNIKNVIKPDGILLITTRSKEFGYHGCPFDFWRYQKSDLKYIFSDFDIEVLENDPRAPGLFLKARKPACFTEKKIINYKLYSIINGRSVSIGMATIYWLVIVVPLFKIFGHFSKFFEGIMKYNAHPFKIPGFLKRKLITFFLR